MAPNVLNLVMCGVCVCVYVCVCVHALAKSRTCKNKISEHVSRAGKKTF